MLLDGAEIAEVQPLDCLTGVCCGLADIDAVEKGHILELSEEVNLLVELLKAADGLGIHGLRSGEFRFVLRLAFNQTVHTVEGHAAVVADDAAAAVGVRKTGDDADVAGLADLIAVDAEDAVVVGGAVQKFLLHLLGELVAVRLTGFSCHVEAAEGVDAAA